MLRQSTHQLIQLWYCLRIVVVKFLCCQWKFLLYVSFVLLKLPIPLQWELTDMGRAGHPVLHFSPDENYQTKDHC